MKDYKISKNLQLRKNYTGFTLIELMLAMIIFSVVLLVILASFLQIGRMFYKGVSVANTQDATRNLVDGVTNDLRFANSSPTIGDLTSSKKYFCAGNHRYTYVLNSKVTDLSTNSAGVLRETVPYNKCPGLTEPGTEAQQLLSPDMQLNAFDLNCATNGCNIHAHVVFYGADDNVFTSSAHPNDPSLAKNDPDAYCKGNSASSQFCAVSDLNSTVLLNY